MKKKIKIGIICLAGIAFISLGVFLISRLSSNQFRQSLFLTPQNNPAATQTFCKPNWTYVNLSECSCPSETVQTIEIPEGGEEAVLICKTISTCKGNSPYENQAISLNYQVQKGSVDVSGCLADQPGGGCQEKTLNLSSGQEFYLASGKEQSVKVSLEKIENNKAYFLFSYGVSPPACETINGCNYACKFIKE